MTSPDDPTPPGTPPPSTGRSLALGCGGFLLFWVAFALLGSSFASSVPLGVTVLAGVVVGAIVVFRGADAPRRALLARVAVGFAVAAVIFGGCLAIIANADFR